MTGSWTTVVRRSAAAAAALLASTVLLAGCGADPAPAAPGRSVGTQLDGAMPAALMKLPLVDSTGHATSLSAYAGKVLVLTPAMTLCQETCPLDTTEIVQTAKAVDTAGRTDAVQFVMLTVDPQRDTPHQLAAYRKLFVAQAALPNWHLLTGTPHDVNRIWNFLGVYRQKVPQHNPPPRNWLTGKVLT
ncbi:MAG: SCO family protein, partial [Trebonia sp.]